MTINYPSSQPDWNQLRWETPDEIDLQNTGVYSFQMPKEFFPYFWGAFSMLMEVNNWREVGTLTQTDMVDIANNEVIRMVLCDELAGCIGTSEAVEDAIYNLILSSPEIQNAVTQASANALYGNSDGVPIEPQENDDLDYVWAGLVGALPIYQDAVQNFFFLVNGAVDAADAILNLVPYATPLPIWYTLIGDAFSFGLAQLQSYMQTTSFEEEFLCNVFDLICGRGEPYVLRDDDITQAMINTGSTVPGFPSAGELPWPYFNFGKFKQLFAINSDTANNNWRALCGCFPTEVLTYDFTAESGSEPNTIYGDTWIDEQGTYESGVGYHAANPYGDYTQIFCLKGSFPFAPTTIERIRAYYTMPASSGGGQYTQRSVVYIGDARYCLDTSSFDASDSPFVCSSEVLFGAPLQLAIDLRAGSEVDIILQKVEITYQV